MTWRIVRPAGALFCGVTPWAVNIFVTKTAFARPAVLETASSELPAGQSETAARCAFLDYPMLKQIISGGQTGVDRAALDASMELGIPVGGWCPKGRRAEDGRVPDIYPLDEMPTEDYRARTRKNAEVADGTLILSLDPENLSGGTLLTRQICEQEGKPWLVVGLPASPISADVLQDWINSYGIAILNVAGPRGSETPAVYELAKTFLIEALNPDPR